jgi:hypothetical protein
MKRIVTTSILCLTIGVSVASCGGKDQPSSAAQAQTQQQTSARGSGGSGKVTDVSGSTAQVQGGDAQVAVSWTGKTTFTQQVDAKASAVKVGSCVMVTPTDPSKSTGTKVSAASVRVTKQVDGTCTPKGGRLRTQNGDGPQGGRPSDMPSGGPGPGRVGGFAIGEVTSVTSTGFTVSARRLGPDADAKTTMVEVTTSDDTTYTTTGSASATDVKVGVCVTSRGKADDTGAIAATSIAVSRPVDGECGMFFAGGRRAGQS